METGSSDRRTSNNYMPCSANVRPIQRLWIAGAVLCCLTPACAGQRAPDAQAQQGSGPGVVVAEAPQESSAKPDKRKVRDAQAAYATGAKKLDADDLDGAEREFQRALTLDPT